MNFKRQHFLLILGVSVFSSWIFCEPIAIELLPFSGTENDRSLKQILPELSGLTESSLYRDPRAWRERLEPATIGTVGTGIGVGDFDQDGWPDLFVAMREGKNRLYLNNQSSGFADHTEAAGILESEDWATGVTVVDINGDGLHDVFVCFFEVPSRVYLNRGDAEFEEVAIDMGLIVSDAVSGAFFADYDKDGDLDLYLQTNTGNDGAGRPDYFFRNEADSGFMDVSHEVGILQGTEGATLGHSVLWIDYDEDGWEDIYVANDFRQPDFLYLNNGDGTFRCASELVPIAPYSSMGSDVGDVNNDGRLDILTTDMATPSYLKHVQSMLTSGTKTRDIPEGSWPRQVMKNCLLLNRGYTDYVDVAYAWNLAATDWTWAPRLVDLDNDGWQDAFFTNGMIRQFHNADLALAQDRQPTLEAKTAVFQRSPTLNERNLVFRNLEGQGYEESNARWKYEDEGVSFGTALLDYDRDGDMDLVYTNYEAAPTLVRNDLGTGNSVQIQLVGQGQNTQAIGAVVIATIGKRVSAQKLMSNRGYLGTDEQVLHFGLGEEERIQKLEIRWADGSRQSEENLRAGYRYIFEQTDMDAALHPQEERARFRFLELISNSEVLGAKRSSSEESHFYPLKPLPGKPKPKLIRADFNQDGKSDSLILRGWETPRLILPGTHPSDGSTNWGLSEMKGLWDVVLVEDFTGDGFPDIFLGGLGINNEFTFRSPTKARLLRQLGRFSKSGPRVNVNAFNWGDELRLFDGLRDLTEIAPQVYRKIPSFTQSATFTPKDFIDRVGFEVEQTYEINRFKSELLINQGGQSFRFESLPLEGQYGRVWDAASSDLNADGNLDLIILLGQVSPHYRSSQDEGSFIYVMIGEGNGRFREDKLAPLDTLPEERVIGLSFIGTEKTQLELEMESGKRAVYDLHY